MGYYFDTRFGNFLPAEPYSDYDYFDNDLYEGEEYYDIDGDWVQPEDIQKYLIKVYDVEGRDFNQDDDGNITFVEEGEYYETFVNLDGEWLLLDEAEEVIKDEYELFVLERG